MKTIPAIILFVLTVPALVALAGCASGSITGTVKPAGDALTLRVTRKPGDRIRTRRTFESREVQRNGAAITVKAEETFVDKTVAVDDFGAAARVHRQYERSLRTLLQPGVEPKTETSSLEGSQLELVRTDNGVTVRVLLGSPVRSALDELLISGFDEAMLPRDAVRAGDAWTVDINAAPTLRGVMKAFGVDAVHNEMRCSLYACEGAKARIRMDWTMTGTVGDDPTPATFRIAGDMVFDTTDALVSELALEGGRADAQGRVKPSFSVRLSRERVQGWYE